MKKKIVKVIFILLLIFAVSLLVRQSYCYTNSASTGFDLHQFDNDYDSNEYHNQVNVIGVIMNVTQLLGTLIPIVLILINLVVRLKNKEDTRKLIKVFLEENKDRSANVMSLVNNEEYQKSTMQRSIFDKLLKIAVISFIVCVIGSIIISAISSYITFLYKIEPLVNSGIAISLIAMIILYLLLSSIEGKIDKLFKTQIEDYSLDENVLLLKQKYEKSKDRTKYYLLAGIILFASTGVLQITKSFKPIIYLYPEQEQVVSVKLGNRELLTTSYPKYEDKWEVLAKPNGDLVDLKTGRNLYALYWEGNKRKVDKLFDKGWCVKGEDTAKFLEEKLEELGLNEREAEEFIVYWLPKLEKNKYNLIKFETQEQIDYNMPLKITPEPDTVIRVMMNYKGVNNYKELEPQKIVTPERNGFTVVEWGGSEIK